MTTHRTYVAIHVFLTVLATAFMVARFVAKHLTANKLTLTTDDALLVAALLLMYSLLVGAILAITLGNAGEHVYALTKSQLEITAMIFWIYQFPHALALTLVRCALVVFLIRTFFTRVTYSRLRLTGIDTKLSILHCFFLLAVGLIRLVTVILVYFVHCRPLRYNWTYPLEDEQYCFPNMVKPFEVAKIMWAMMLDVSIWSLPHFVVWQLQLRLAHKIAISFIFALGLLNILVAVFRVISIVQVDFHGDANSDLAAAMVWIYAQLSTAIILACCPLLRPVLEMVTPRRLTRIRRRTTSLSNRRTAAKIQKTTSIHVHTDSSEPRSQPRSFFHDDAHIEPQGPKFEMEQSEPIPSRRSSCC